MPTWLIMFLARVAINIGVGALEKKYPGIKPVLDKIVAFIDGGGTTSQVSEHLDRLSEFQATDLKK